MADFEADDKMVVDIPVVDEQHIVEVGMEVEGDADELDVEVVEIGFEDLVVDFERDMPQVIAEEVMDVHGDEPEIVILDVQP